MQNKYVRQQLGQKKLAPVNMKKNEYQFVIDSFLIKDVLKQIPNDIKIIQSQVLVYTQTAKKRVIVPNILKKKGVQYVRELGWAKEVVFVFDKASKELILKNVTDVCEKENLSLDKAYFKYIIFSNGDATARFEHCTKEQRPDETDLRKKLRVLGCVSGTGRVQGLISQLNATKFHCSIKEEVVKMIMCTKE